jgi:Leucine-rich repeat (LRR) protein
LDLVWDKPCQAMSRIAKWRRLRELCFFNPLLKAPPEVERLDESPVEDTDLASINNFTQLRSLGLCGRSLTARAIIKMPLLHKLDTLKLKSIEDVGEILQVLPELRNLKELWLVHDHLKDRDLAPLTLSNNISTLRIRRNHLTPSSVTYFSKMSNLKNLVLDGNWSREQRDTFKAALPRCHVEFEPSSDLSYWHVMALSATNHKGQK